MEQRPIAQVLEVLQVVAHQVREVNREQKRMITEIQTLKSKIMKLEQDLKKEEPKELNKGWIFS
tara:strand:- start:465 stop:656 length:192 start_codon:yes stop_codon:yes gene_type:complete